MEEFNCRPCPSKHNCCQEGVWVDLDEAKKILCLTLSGKFFHLEEDDGFPSGYKIATCIDDNPCSFLNRKGFCEIHKLGYALKPAYCKQFPYEDGGISSDAKYLCLLYDDKIKNNKKK